MKLNSGVDYRGVVCLQFFDFLVSRVWLRRIFIHHSLFPKKTSSLIKTPQRVNHHNQLACLDGYMNVAMEQTEEYQDGQLKAKYGDAFIRGNNGASGVCVSASRA